MVCVLKMKFLALFMTDLKKERPSLPDEILVDVKSLAEGFQNRVLRPTIKMQSELLLLHLNAKMIALNVDLDNLDIIQKRQIFMDLLTRNQAFKQEVVGMVIGQFSVDEYLVYAPMSKEINRRITQIVLNRILDLKLR